MAERDPLSAEIQEIKYTKIKLRRGNESDLPLLDEGEPALSLDTEKFFVGSPSGNIQLADNRDVEAIKSGVQEVESGISTIQQNLQTIQTELDGVETNMSTIQTDLNSARANINTLQIDMEDAKTDISTLETNLSTTQTEVSTLHTDMNTAQTDIINLKTDIDTAQTDISTLQTDASTLQTDIISLKTDVQNVESDVGTLQQSLQSTVSGLPITPEEYGAIGDGVADDTSALQAAIDATPNGGSLRLVSKKYRTTRTLNVTKDITFFSDIGSEIFLDSTSARYYAIHAQGSIKSTKTLSQSITINEDKIYLSDTNGIDEGDLLQIVTDTPWYYDPRGGTLYKGELHKVAKIVDSNKVSLQPQVTDGYNKDTENITINIISPISVNIKNVKITRPLTTNKVTGMRFEYCSRSTLLDVTVERATYTGILFKCCYDTSVERPRVHGSNDDTAGYGIQTYGTALTYVSQGYFWGSRRGVDISGNYPDIFSTVDGCTVVGGGYNKNGAEYSAGDLQYGMGSHSTASYTTFSNNTFINLSCGISSRGLNAVIENNRFIGYFSYACITLGYGEAVTIQGNQYESGIGGIRDRIAHNGTNVERTAKADSFVLIFDTFGMDRAHLIIKDNVVKNVVSRFIRIFQSTSTDRKFTYVNGLQVTNNTVGYRNSANASPFYLVYSDFSVNGANCVFKGNLIQRESGTSPYIPFYNFDPYRNSEGGATSFSIAPSPTTYSFYLNDDMVKEIPVGSFVTDWVRIIADTNMIACNCKIINKSSSKLPTDIFDSYVVLGSTALTGTTGTDGKFTISLVDGVLYLENRIGTAVRGQFTVLNLA